MRAVESSCRSLVYRALHKQLPNHQLEAYLLKMTGSEVLPGNIITAPRPQAVSRDVQGVLPTIWGIAGPSEHRVIVPLTPDYCCPCGGAARALMDEYFQVPQALAVRGLGQQAWLEQMVELNDLLNSLQFSLTAEWLSAVFCCCALACYKHRRNVPIVEAFVERVNAGALAPLGMRMFLKHVTEIRTGGKSSQSIRSSWLAIALNDEEARVLEQQPSVLRADECCACCYDSSADCAFGGV